MCISKNRTPSNRFTASKNDNGATTKFDLVSKNLLRRLIYFY